MSATKGDFIGFTYGGVHSSELGIMRVSNGSRYSETLLPEFSNKTVNVPGANRVDYLGMESTQKSFPIDFAFDSVTEEQLRKMKRLFGSEKPLPLVFDESPYKTWYAKVGGNPSFNYICFDEEDIRFKKIIEYHEEREHFVEDYIINTDYNFNNQILKVIFDVEVPEIGKVQEEVFVDSSKNFSDIYYILDYYGLRMNISFFDKKVEIVFSSYIYDYTYNDWINGPVTTKNFNIIFLEKNIHNKRIYKGEGKVDLVSFYPYAFCDPNFAIGYDSTKQPDNYYEWIDASGLREEKLVDNEVYNPGDFEAPFWLKITDLDIDDNNNKSLQSGGIEIDGNSLKWLAGAINEDDTYIIVDGRTQLIEGYNDNGKTGRIYNHLITSGNWFKIPISTDENPTFTVDKPDGSELHYKILYK